MKQIISCLLATSMVVPNLAPAVIPIWSSSSEETSSKITIEEENYSKEESSSSKEESSSSKEESSSSKEESSFSKEESSSSKEESSSSKEESSSSKEESSSSKEESSSSKEESSSSKEESSSSKEESSSSEQDASSGLQEPVAMQSQIVVNLSAALPLKKDLDATLTLRKEGFERQGKMILKQGDDAIPGATFSFADLEDGEYTLTIEALGFEKWEQKILVEDQQAVQLEIYTGYLAGYNYAKNAIHPGALRIGDVDRDGQVSQQDKNTLIDALANQSTDKSLDLNGDDLVTLLDLEYLASSLDYINQGAEHQSTTETRSLSVAIPDAKTEVKGDLKKLMTEEGTVQLKSTEQKPISQENPVALTFDFSTHKDKKAPIEQVSIQSVAGENEISDGVVQIAYIDENGQEQTMEISLNPMARQMLSSGVSVVRDENGNLTVDFGKQIAVKKVTITITGTKNNTNLAEISKVDFVNNMENRIPAPEMNIPENLKTQPGDKQFTISWNNAPNVTGYEVEIIANGKTEVRRTTTNRMNVTSFDGKKLVNNTDYSVRVQSINGEWKSGYSDAVTVRPMATKVPFAPDNVKVEGAYRALNVTWKDMEDTDSYSVYYRLYDQGEYIKAAENITKNQYTITDLEAGAKYQVFVVGKNDMGESAPSLIAVGTTQDINPVKMPDYKLINTSNGQGQVTNHIKTVERRRGNNIAKMVNSPLDAESKTALGLVDGEESSYYRVDDWDDGCVYTGRNGKGLMFVFDQEQSIGSFSFSEPVDNNFINKVRVEYLDKETNGYKTVNANLVRNKTENDRYYYTVKWQGEIKTDQLYLAVSGWDPLQIAEVKFYEYDSIADDINDLFADAYHTQLKPEVTTENLNALQERVDTVDPVSQEYHPDRDLLQKELDNARSILNTESLGEIFLVKNTITARGDNGYGFTGLNPWQPLGIVASEGDKLIVYVGAPGKKTGENTELNLIATQYHAEAGETVANLGQLKIGRNEITIPAINSLDAEHGGALYVQYTGGVGGTQYGVRVSGGTQVPILDLYGVEDKQERVERAKTYLQQLTQYNTKIEQMHNELHEGAYDEKNCVLGATDILLDEMMISVPVQQVLAGVAGGDIAQQAEKIEQSMTAMDDMMQLFYQHKGLNDNSPNAKLPSQHLNIRYQRMFGGAFMYATGNHIGIEWPETIGMMQGVPVVADETGKYISGDYFGWGIGHEIGHNINQGSYAVAEVTNNYFAQLSQARETSDSVRFNYSSVYEKVTSNTIGDSGNVFTQLAMYWQLHLAYDNYHNFKIFDNYEEQLNNLFYARVDTYARNPRSAPAPSGVALTLGGNADQNIMRLASAAAQKDLTDFFVRWGKTPDAQTLAYAAQFPKEERAIYYVNDDARTYRIANPDASSGFKGQAVVADTSSVSVKDNAVTINIQNTLGNKDTLLGYEISRVIMNGGKEIREVVGFTTKDTYTDIVTGINNRVIRYEITAVDQYLQHSAVHSLTPVKIAHDGSHDKSMWNISTNMTSEQDALPPATENEPCAPEEKSAIYMAIDNDAQTVYTGSTQGEARIQLDFKETLPVTGLKYTAGSANGIKEYAVEISTDGSKWKTVAKGSFPEGQATSTVYFRNENNDPWVATYDAAYLRLTVKGQNGQNISISELDVLGPTGDNVAWRTDIEGAETVGILEQDYVYDSASGAKIPKDSLVFIGQYKGNPAYNVVLLFDENGNIVGGTDQEGNLVSNQIILADVPEHGELGETSDGSWIYWIEPTPENSFGTLPKTVRTELYRVDNALTNEGQRMVSDSFALQMPEELPKITLK